MRWRTFTIAIDQRLRTAHGWVNDFRSPRLVGANLETPFWARYVSA
jgi:hypothetical protein